LQSERLRPANTDKFLSGSFPGQSQSGRGKDRRVKVQGISSDGQKLTKKLITNSLTIFLVKPIV